MVRLHVSDRTAVHDANRDPIARALKMESARHLRRTRRIGDHKEQELFGSINAIERKCQQPSEAFLMPQVLRTTVADAPNVRPIYGCSRNRPKHPEHQILLDTVQRGARPAPAASVVTAVPM
jgi:hypothetical protein